MRRILVETARRKGRARGTAGADGQDLRRPARPRRRRGLAGDSWTWTRRWTRLATEEPSAAELVKLRYFAGLTVEEAAEALGDLGRTADRDWAYARAWLFQQLSD